MQKKKIPQLLGLFLVTLVLPQSGLAADQSSTEVVELPPMVVAGRFSELVCGVRFRFNIPGNRMRSLVVRKMPASWAATGVMPGDRILAIDGRKIDGQGLVELGKYLESKPKAAPVRFVFDVQSKQSKTVHRLEMTNERESDEITIAYP